MVSEYNFQLALREARQRLGWSYRVTSRQIGVSTRTIQNWQNGEHPGAVFSDARVRRELANMMEISEFELLKLLGILPENAKFELDSEIATLNPISVARNSAESAMSLIGDRHPDWLRMEKVAMRGTLSRVRYHTLLGLTPTSRDRSTTGDTTQTRRYISENLLQPIWGAAGLHWRNGKPPGWEHSSEFLIQISSQERTRPIPEPRNLFSKQLQILTVGLPWVHAELLGSFIADALSFGYIDPRYPVDINGLPTLDSEFQAVASNLRKSGNGHVVSVGSGEIAAKYDLLLRSVAERSVVVLCTGETFMESIGRWVYPDSPAEIECLKKLMNDLLNYSARSKGVIQIHFTDEDFDDIKFGGDHVSQEASDRACDLALAASNDVVRLLRQKYSSVPSPDQWRGHPLVASDSLGRISLDRRANYTAKWK